MSTIRLFFLTCCAIGLLQGCQPKSKPSMNDQYRDQLQSWDFTNDKGMSMRVTNFGGRVVSLIVPDKNGNPVDGVLGYVSLTP